MVTTKVFLNSSDEPVTVLGVGEIPAGERVSVTSEYHQPIVLANFPGVVDVTDEASEAPVAPEVAVEAPVDEVPSV